MSYCLYATIFEHNEITKVDCHIVFMIQYLNTMKLQKWTVILSYVQYLNTMKLQKWTLKLSLPYNI